MVIWKGFAPWGFVPLGKSFYEFHFGSANDKRKVWYVGSYNLQSGLLRLSKWEPNFNPYTKIHIHIQSSVRFL